MTSPRLAGKVALITGAAAGIGRATAFRFATEGAKLFLIDVDSVGGEAVERDIAATGAEVVSVTADLSDEVAVAGAFRRLDSVYGRLDILFNCAGGSSNDDNSVDILDLSVAQTTVRNNLLTTIVCSKEAIPRIEASGGGSVINMSSVHAFRASAGVHAYSAAKGAISSLTRGMAASYATRGIRVNAIAPAAVLTERAKRRMSDDNISQHRTFQRGDYPFSISAPEDVAAIALFLASDESRMIVGQTIVADGGLTSY